jgi:nucleoside recognition membrane protein YjiH
MNETVAIGEIIFAIIYTIAGFIVYELIKSKDGVFRKIMIAYFSSIILIYVGTALYSIFPKSMDVNLFRIIVCTPKAITMLWLYAYLRKQNPK